MRIARLNCVLFIFFLISVGSESIRGYALLASQSAGAVSTAESAQQPVPDLKGIWSGTFISKNSDIPPFTITVKISADARGRLIGDASLVSHCLTNHQLQVTVNGSNVVLAGSDEDSDTVTFRGTVDNTGTVLSLNYIINGSASRRCEIDDGSGTMMKR